MDVWYTGAITSGSADTMEEENLKQGWRRLGGAFSPPEEGLSFSKARSQQSAVAALHQSESGLDQPFDLIPHLMGFPIPFSYALAGQQNFGDFAMGSAVGACIRRAQGECYPSPAICRNRVWRRALRPAIESFPQANTGTRPEFEVAVERQFDSVGGGGDWRFLEPNAMLYTAQMQHGVPTIRTLSKLAFVQLIEIKPD